MQSMLEEVGYDVTCESDGEKGLRRMAMLQPDHVLLDYELLARGDGVEAERKIRK